MRYYKVRYTHILKKDFFFSIKTYSFFFAKNGEKISSKKNNKYPWSFIIIFFLYKSILYTLVKSSILSIMVENDMTKFSSFSSIHLPPPLFFRGRLWVSIFLISTFPSIHLPTYLLPRLFQLTMKSVGYFFISSSLARRTLQTFHFFINNHAHFTKISSCLDLLPIFL